MVDSRTNPMDVDQVGDDTVDAEIRGEQEPLKMHEAGATPPPGSLDAAGPVMDAAGNSQGDPGRVPGSRDPDAAGSLESDGRPESRGGDTPYDAQGTAGSEGE